MGEIEIGTFSPDVVLKALRNTGVCVVRNYLYDTQVSELKDLAEEIFTSKSEQGPSVLVHSHPNNKGGLVARLKTDQLDGRFRALASPFLSLEMEAVCNAYFGTKSCLNDDIFVTHEKPCAAPILPWHFDRQQSLKFYVNLIDADSSNGAFEYDVGSHREGHFRANYYLLQGVPVGDIPNDIPEDELRNPSTINASAGDLIIFDPDGFHRGGVVSEGKERMVIRGHSHPLPNRGYQAKRFDALWWLQSRFNLAKWLSRNGTRTLGRGFLTNALCRDEK